MARSAGSGDLALARGERVQVWSDSSKAWLDGRVEEVYIQAGFSDGYSIPAGCIKVSSSAGIKYVLPGQASKLLRPASPHGAGREHAASSSGSGRPRPTVRHAVGAERLEARDRWNTYEIKLQEIFMEYDRDSSGSLEVDEFRELLRDFNDGVEASNEEYAFMMHLCDKDHDGKINLGELHYALRAWNSYRQLGGSVLRLFAAFDTDASGRLDPAELQGLLTAMNEGIMVPMTEVLHVIEQAGGIGEDAISRPELLGAIACWYAQVSRQDTDLFALLQEAATRTARDSSQQEALSEGIRGLGAAYADDGGYAPVLEQDQPPELAAAGSVERPAPAAGWGADSRGSLSRINKAAPHCLRSSSSLCYASSPFLLGWVMALGGWHHRFNHCPRNLDGILVWFGLLVLLLGSLNHVRVTDVLIERARLAVGVMLATLSMIGLLWTLDDRVQENLELCGHTLVWWSRLAWLSIPTCGCGYGCYTLAWHMKRLRIKDERLQQEIVL